MPRPRSRHEGSRDPCRSDGAGSASCGLDEPGYPPPVDRFRSGSVAPLYAAGRGLVLFGGGCLGLVAACGAPAIPLGEVCPEVECLDAFEVEFEREDDWAPGAYEVEVVLDDEIVICTTELPPPCDAEPACPEGSGLTLSRSGCDEGPALRGVSLAQGAMPEAVKVSVRHEGDSLAARTFTPTYETTQPAGMGCFPFCDTADPEILEID